MAVAMPIQTDWVKSVLFDRGYLARIRGDAIKVYLVMLEACGGEPDRSVTISLSQLMRRTRLSCPTVIEGLARLEDLGLVRQDDTRVMVRDPLAATPLATDAAGVRFERLPHRAFAETIGRFRGSALGEREAHAQRLAEAPVLFSAFVVVDESDRIVACGQLAVEGDLVGIYDVFTVEAKRGRGLATRLCAHLIEEGRRLGAVTAYLQVEASNVAARAVYRRLGFIDAYAYHYRTRA
jgi:GNAT superfamily N-acetyltransferase